jgi:cellulose synthase/poly-beta-1,6-N-acetylglucosamine synthase-like glycosyltransferase
LPSLWIFLISDLLSLIFPSLYWSSLYACIFNQSTYSTYTAYSVNRYHRPPVSLSPSIYKSYEASPYYYYTVS